MLNFEDGGIELNEKVKTILELEDFISMEQVILKQGDRSRNLEDKVIYKVSQVNEQAPLQP